MLKNDPASGNSPFYLRPGFLFLLILLAGLAVRLLLLPVRWINPDEGSHLLDARLLLAGQVPVGDFGSRQPLYVLIIAVFLKIFGVTLTAGRLMPLFSSLGVVAVLYVMGKRWFDERTGLVAAFLYALLPLVVIWSTIVKTEQLSILFGVLSMFLLLEGQEKKAVLLLGAGIFAAFAFYVRQSTLYLPMAAVVFLILGKKNWLKNILLFLGGYLLVVLVVFAIYLRHITFSEILFSQLNPLDLIWSRLMHLFGWLPAAHSITDAAGFRFLDQDMSYTLNSWYHSLAFSLLVICGGVAVIFSKRFSRDSRQGKATLLFALWAGIAVLLYLYQTASRGFYTQYFTEMLPPLMVLAAVLILDIADAIKWPNLLLALLGLAGFYGIYLVQRMFWQITPGMIGYLVLSIGLALLVYFIAFASTPSFGIMAAWTLIPILAVGGAAAVINVLGMHDLYRFLLLLLILFTALYGLNLATNPKMNLARIFLLFGFFYAAFFSGHIMGPRYEAVWSPATLKETVAFLKNHSETGDDVLSGGTIWTFESGLAPYLNTPHPTEFFKHRMADFETTFLKNPPQFIILDGYTERKFSRYWDFLKERLAIQYEKAATMSGSNAPVEIFQLKPQPRGESGFITQEGLLK